MMSGLKEAIQNWDMEVEHEAIRLIEKGVPPWDAIDQARDVISVRRARQHQDKQFEQMARNTFDK